MSGSPLFQPCVLAGLELKNRLVMAPMTRQYSPRGVPTLEVANYYARRADADVGLIITEGTFIEHPSACNSPNVPHIYGAAALEGWRRVIQAVHAAGSRIVLQLWHVGALAFDSAAEMRPNVIVSPSGFYRQDQSVGNPMSQQEIDEIVAAYATAVETAQQIGFDGVEYHGAHGYLIDQFFWSRTNCRQDAYGGDWRGRTRLACEILEESRRRAGPDFPLILRISQFKYEHYEYKLAHDPRALAEMIAPMVEAGVSVFHCSQRRFWQPEFAGSALNLAAWVKKLSGIPVITVGSVGLDRDSISTNYLEKGTRAASAPLDALEGMVERGEVDLVAVGRALLQDPLWAQKVRRGEFRRLMPYDVNCLSRLY